jgi:membrane-bound lytic murein transglycosylase B
MMFSLKQWRLLTYFWLCLVPIMASAQELPSFKQDPAVQTFIEQMTQKHGLDTTQLQQWFAQAQLQPEVLNAIARPYEALPWHRYQRLFLTPQHIQEGATFWQRHHATLSRAQAQYGVPAEIIIAVLGVETRYGQHKGKYPVLDALATLAFHYPPRAKFFKSELEQYLLLLHEEKLDPTIMKGSYAGAMGVPQFIASSYRHYAVDFSGSGQRDIIHNVDDAIGSIANYFAKHGWKKEMPVVLSAMLTDPNAASLKAKLNNPKPTYLLSELQQQGVQLSNDSLPANSDKMLMALIELEAQSGPAYWLGLHNFYVITRYNHSSLYAMAIYQLSQQIKQQYLAS